MLKSMNTLLASEPDEEIRYQIVQQQSRLPFEQSKEVLFAALGDPSWRVRKQAVEQLLVASGLAADDLNILVGLLRDEDNAGLRNSTAELLIRLGVQSVPVLLNYLSDPDHDLRKQIVDALGAIGGAEALQGLRGMLADPDSNVASAAAEGIGASGNSSYAAELIRCLEQTEDQFLRFNLLASLGRIGTPGPLPAIIHQLAADVMLSRAVYECLGKIGGDIEAVDLLIVGVCSNLPSVRLAAWCALAAVLRNIPASDQPAAIQRLKAAADGCMLDQLLADASSGGVKGDQALITVLGYLQDVRGIPLLLRALTNDQLSVQAAQVLSALGNQAVIEAISYFDQTQDSAERAAICQLLGACNRFEDAGVIGRALVDEDDRVRAAAAAAVMNMSVVDETVLALLVTRLTADNSMAVRRAALSSLQHYASLHGDIVSAAALQMAHSQDAELRRGAAQLFVALHDHEQLARLFKDEDSTVREAAARAASRVGGREGCSHLVVALVDEDPDVRIAAAEALGDCRDDSAIEPLRLSLHDRDPWVQAAALKSLVCLAGMDCLADIVCLWEHGDDVVQLACLEAFRLLGMPECMQAVANNLGHRTGEVLKGAIELLHAYDPAQLAPWLNHLVCHPDWDVRITMIRASGELVKDHAGLFRAALDCEQDSLVKSEIMALLSRV